MRKLVGRKWLTRRRRVGVIGLLQAGKIAFFTALVNQFKDHRPRDFPCLRRMERLVAKSWKLRNADRRF